MRILFYIKCEKCGVEGSFVEDLKGNPNQSLSRHLPKLPPPFFQTPWSDLFIMAKLEMAEIIDVKMWKKCHLIPKCLLPVGYPILLSKNQMSKNKSNLEMDIFPHFKFFNNRRKWFMLGFSDGLIDETCNLQLSFKQNQKIFYADIRCIWNFLFLKHEKIIRVSLYLA